MSETRQYELVYIVTPDAGEEVVADLHKQVEAIVQRFGGNIEKTENWGRRRLAYDIRKQREGTYAVFEVLAEPSMVKEFERQLRLNDNVLRFLSTRVPVRKRIRPAKTQESPPAGDPVLEEVG